MTTLYLVRHGETDWNAERRVQGQMDSVLNQRGAEQAAALRPGIENLQIQQAYTSTSVRTRQTADILLANTDLPLIADPDLREIKLGPWEGVLWADVDKSYPHESAEFKNNPHLFSLDGAESYLDVQERAVNCLQRIVAECAEKAVDRVLIVSHGMFIKTLIGGLAGIPAERLREGPDIANCSVSIVDCKESTFHVREIGGQPFDQVDW